MKNFFISAVLDLIIIFVSYFIFRFILKGSTRHKIYEKLFSSFGKFIIYIFLITVIITSLSAFALYRTRYIAYVNIVAPALVSILVGFVMSTVPTRGIGDEG
ncbi:hypothetical protein [Clostridium tetani]|uniref:hypothetical protein n=1 Tax=Clostridium tetani TaxID=1513 RepID=UPI000513C7D6|nr:hypothetical protein [Clostridium tetani]KGI38791.1 membrane protein [Clostridium tetani ATCC 9441]SUY67717.1 membrane protein [Clostridium tetani]